MNETKSVFRPRLLAFCVAVILYGVLFHLLCKYASPHTYVIVTSALLYVLTVVILAMIFKPLRK